MNSFRVYRVLLHTTHGTDDRFTFATRGEAEFWIHFDGGEDFGIRYEIREETLK